MSNPTVIKIVKEYLEKNKYDGLLDFTGDCACELSDLAPCGEMGGGCEAGYKTKCNPEDCPMDGDCDFHIAEFKEITK